MSEANETPVKVEKEPSAVKRVAEKIGTFLKETYTIKGATAKEIRKYEKAYSSFTPSQREELIAFNEKAIHKTARNKVIKNWLLTGAGIAAGWAVAHFGPVAIWKFATDTAPAAIAGGVKAVGAWMFEPHIVNVNVPKELAQNFTNLVTNLSKGPQIPWPVGIKFGVSP